MIYVIYGNEPFLINQKLNSIIKDHSDAYVTRFNGLDSSFSIDEMLNTCQSIGLFASKSLVIVKDPYFLIKKVDDKLTSSFIDYVNNQIYESILVLYTLDNMFNTRLKIFKDISLNAQIIELNKMKKYDFFNYARSLIKERALNISKDGIELLVNNSNYDISLIVSNLDILSLYPDYLDESAIKKLISFPNEDDTFLLINALTQKKISLSISLANKLLENDESVLKLISTIGAQLRYLYEVSYLFSINKSFNEICKITNSKEYRVTKALETLKILKEKDILRLQNKLADLDFKIKTQSDISDKLNLELFIVSLMG